MLRHAATALLALALLIAPATAQAADPFSSPAADQLVAAAAPPSGFTDTAVWTGLVTPTTLRWAPDGRVFVAQKNGIVNVFDNTSDPIPTVYTDLRQNVDDFLDRGLLGLAVDPRFTQGRPYIYVLYTYDKDPNSSQFPRWGDDCPDPPGADGDGCVVTGRLSRIDPDGTEHVLIEDWCNQFSTHTIGALNFGPDGALYASSGDGASYTFADYGQGGSPRNPCGDPPGGVGGAMSPPTAEGGALRSQAFRRPAGQPVTLDGSIIRIDPDTGAAMPDNPAAGDANANRRRIVAYGMRNPFRFTFRPDTSEIWFGDVGWNTWEELNRIPSTTSVRNYGWPCYEGDARMSSYDTLNLNLCESLYTQGTASGPHWRYDHGAALPGGSGCPSGTSSITGVAFYTGTQFPAQYRNALFMADYARRCIIVMLAGADGVPDPSTARIFESDAAGPVDIQMGPDGRLYYADLEGGAIRRIAYPSGNNLPTARATATPDHGPTPLSVAFDGSASSDPDGGTLTYSWDLDGNGTFGDATIAKPGFTYSTPGQYTARLRVTDSAGGTDTATVPITAGTPPSVTIANPTGAFTWAVGDAINFAGSAVDGQGNPIPASGLSWQLNILHCARTDTTSCHTHFGSPVNGVASGSMVAPNHDYPSRLQLVLTATDANGLTASKSVTMDPKTVDITLASNRAGAELTIGADTGSAPFTQRFIQNATTDITAPSPQTIGGSVYEFSGWSDGGAITHTITVPRTDTTYTATFDPSTENRLAGLDEVGPNVSQASAGRAEVYRTTATTTGSATKLRLYVDSTSTATRLGLGLYADNNGEVGALLGQGVTTALTPGAWNTVTLPTAIPVTQGTAYWIGLLNPSNGTGVLKWRDRVGAGGGSEQTSAGSTLATLPSPWATGGRFTDGPASAYVLGTTGPPPAPELSVTPSTLAFTGVAGGAAPAAKNLTISHSGGGSLDFTASDDASWLSVTPTTGPAARDVTVSIDSSGLAAGTYNGTVTIAAPGATGSPKLIPVTLTLTAPTPPSLSVSPGSLTFSAVAGAANPAPQSLAVANGGTGTLSYTASDDASWLSVSPTSGTAPGSVAVAVDIAGLSPGTHTGNVTITAAGASGSPQVVPVTLTVAPSGGDLLGGANVIGSGTSSAPVGAGEAYRLTASAGGTVTKLRLYVDGANAATRLTLGLYGDASGTATSLLGSGTTTTVTAGAWNDVTLATPLQVTAGTAYWFALLNPTGSGGTLRWRDRAGGGGGPEQTSANRNLAALPATWAALASYNDGPVSGTLFGALGAPPPPALAVAPGSLAFSATAGGSNPAGKTLSVTNTGGGTVNFTASDDAPWLTVAPASGSAPRDLTVSVDVSGLAAGTHTGNVTVNAGAAGTRTIPVTLTLAAPSPPVLAVSPSSLAFSAVQGGAAPGAQSLSVTNTGGGTLSFTASDDAAWLSAAPSSGSAPASVSVSVAPAGLAPGTYNGTVTIDGGSAGTKTVAVSFTVTSPSAGLVGAWGFDEASGTTATDGSGSGNNGTLTGPVRTTAGKFGGALTFDGVNDWVTVADAASLRLSTGATIEAWVRPTIGAAGSWRTVAMKATTNGLAYALYAFGDGGLPSGHAFTSIERWARGPSAPPLNAWTHLATTYDGTTIRLYVGGVQVATQAQSGALVAGTGPLRFGGNAAWPEWFQGQLDEIRVYNRALTAAELQADMARPVGSAAAAARATAARAGKRGRRHHRARRHAARKRHRNPGVQRLRYRAKHAHGGGPLRPKVLRLGDAKKRAKVQRRGDAKKR